MDRQLLLLGLLRREEMHGYQLNEFIEEKMHYCIDLKRPTAYYVLDKLAQEGYVEMEREQEGNRPPRRVYHITKAGEAHFFDLLRQNLADYSRSYYPTDVGIAFMDQLPPERVADYLRQKQARIAAELEGLQHATGHSGPLRHVLEHNRRMLQTECDWLQGLLAEIEEKREEKG
jgi:DNA-binding PadR family transcriptional regulator